MYANTLENRRRFVEVSAFHGTGRFVELQLLAQTDTDTGRIGGDTKLFSGSPVTFDFVHVDAAQLWFQGRTANASIEQRILQESGVWQASFRCEVGNAKRFEYLLFEWHDIAIPPRPYALATRPELPPGLAQGHLDVLKTIAEADRPQSAKAIAGRLGTSEQKAQYFLDRLHSDYYLERGNYLGEPYVYSLSAKGRAFLVEHGLL